MNQNFENVVATKGNVIKLGDLDATLQNIHENYISLEKIYNN